MKNLAKARLFARSIIFAALFAANCAASYAKDSAVSYLAGCQGSSTNLLPPPPMPSSREQAADLATVVASCKSCPTNEAAQANSEKKINVFNFACVVGPFFQPSKLPKTEAFFTQVGKEAEAEVDVGKDLWKRPRPFVVDPSLANGEMEHSFGYPSGHSTRGTVYSLLLAEIFPEKREDILAMGRNIGWRRVEIARHYPTDIYAGRVLGQAIVRELKASSSFRRDFEDVKAEIHAAQSH